MAFSGYSSQLLALFLILFIVHFVRDNPATQQQIDRVRRQMEDYIYGFCNRTFNENVRGSTDDAGLTFIANDQVRRNACNTYQFIEQLQAGAYDPATRAALDNCRIGCNQVQQVLSWRILTSTKETMPVWSRLKGQPPRGEAFCRPPMPVSPLVERKRD